MKFDDIKLTGKQWLSLAEYYDSVVPTEPPEGYVFTGKVLELGHVSHPYSTYYLNQMGSAIPYYQHSFQGTAFELEKRNFRYVTASRMVGFPVKGDYIMDGFGIEFILVEKDFPEAPGYERMIFEKEYVDGNE